jgi:hypothetical protein
MTKFTDIYKNSYSVEGDGKIIIWCSDCASSFTLGEDTKGDPCEHIKNTNEKRKLL